MPDATETAVSQPFMQHVGYTLFGIWQIYPIPAFALHFGEGFCFPGLLPPNNIVTPNLWWELSFVIGKMSTLAHFLIEPGCDNYIFLDQAVGEFEHGLVSILMDSVEI